MGKIGGGFWTFLAGKRAVSDSELLVTLIRLTLSVIGSVARTRLKERTPFFWVLLRLEIFQLVL